MSSRVRWSITNTVTFTILFGIRDLWLYGAIWMSPEEMFSRTMAWVHNPHIHLGALVLLLTWTAFMLLIWVPPHIKARTRKYPTPFSGSGIELIEKMNSVGATNKDGIFEIKKANRIETKEWFNTPIAFRVVAKTNSTNIRLSYVEDEIIFKWEIRDDLGILIINGGPLVSVKEHRLGEIPENEWVTIDLIYKLDSFTIRVDGSERFSRGADFSKCNRPLSVFTGANATVHVKSVMAGPPKSIEAESPPVAGDSTAPTEILSSQPI